MPVAISSAIVSPLDSVKMDERKRPAADDPGSTPPLKRQATATNGSSTTADSDLPWNEDIDRYQKDAILRQMREYKREKNVLEQQLVSMTKRAEHHDDHIRRVNGWFMQLLQEVIIIFNTPHLMPEEVITHIKASLLTSNDSEFTLFLEERSDLITSTLKVISETAPSVSPDMRAFQERVSIITAAERQYNLEIERIKSEVKVLQERLENAVSRYMLAEKKFDRMRSAQVAKLEAQAIATSRPDGSGGHDDPESRSEDGIGGAAAEAARKEAVAIAEKRTEQLEKVVTENVKLTNDITTLHDKLAALSDEDYANSDLFKTLKSQHEDVIKRLNDLEATNIQLRDEAKALHGERIAHREEVENELRSATIEMQGQIAQRDAEIIRVKHKRDEATAELSVKEASVNANSAYFEQERERAKALELRIETLESEVERLRNSGNAELHEQDHSSLDPAAMAKALSKTLSENKSLNKEVTSMELAFRKAATIANRKIGDIIDAEAKVAKHAADKSKADQRYFASMKVNESMKAEVKALRNQDSKSSDIVSQLKDAETQTQTLLLNRERQLAETKDALTDVSNQFRSAQKLVSQFKSDAGRFAVRADELLKKVKSRDAMLDEAAKIQREAEVQHVEFKAKLAQTEKSLASWKKKGIGNNNEQYETLRTMAQCNVCHNNWKNTAIRGCGHVCCKECVDKQIQLRSRKCPLCGKVFASSDTFHITL